MYRMDVDLKKQIIFIPKETAEAIGHPDDIRFLYRENTDSLILANAISVQDPIVKTEKKRGRPVNRVKPTMARSWDEEAQGYRIKGYSSLFGLPYQYGLSPDPGTIQRTTSSLYGTLEKGNQILFDLSILQLEEQWDDMDASDCSIYEIVKAENPHQSTKG